MLFTCFSVLSAYKSICANPSNPSRLKANAPLRIPCSALILAFIITSSQFVNAFTTYRFSSSAVVKCSFPVRHASFRNELQSNSSDMNRRDYISSLFWKAILSCQVTTQPSLSGAAEIDKGESYPTSVTILRGLVTLKSGSEPTSSASAALYITVKPETTNSAPKEIIDRFSGRSPPVLSARFPVSMRNDATGENVLGASRMTFPFEFHLTESDITAEGLVRGENDKYDSNHFWWTSDNLIVSARLDSDGVAATRDPDDLVGRTIAFVPEKVTRNIGYDLQVNITLQGRGIGGKFITTKKD